MLGFKFWKVRGQSMAPKIPPGSYILANHWLTRIFLREGQTILIEHPKFGLIIKTVASIDHYGFVWSRGENNDSITIEEIGPIDKKQIAGRVIGIFKRPAQTNKNKLQSE